jgi:hypothetical protein
MSRAASAHCETPACVGSQNPRKTMLEPGPDQGEKKFADASRTVENLFAFSTDRIR